MQKTNFDFEVIISDDCSTDGTAEIIKEYMQRYPEVIRGIFREKNTGAVKNFIETLALAKSEYVVINEGDDYFTDENKLQKQVDFLETHPNYTACFHPVKVLYENNDKKNDTFPSKRMLGGRKVISFNDLIEKNYIQTNSILYRWRFVQENIKDFFPENILPADHYLHLLHAQKGDIAMLSEVMSVYRKHCEGIWYDSQNNLEQLHLKHGLQEINFHYNVYKNMTESSDKYLNEKFLPVLRSIMDIFYKNKKYCELEKISSQYPQYYNLVFEQIGTYTSSSNKKLKKYKKLFLYTAVAAVICFVLNIALGVTLYFLIHR